MKKKSILLPLCLCAMMSHAQTPETFKPYTQTDLRLPSVPLVVNDPYFSIWSPFDHLNDGTTRMWYDVEKPIDGLVRVDGVAYSFMGTTERTKLKAIAPMANEQAWQAKYSRQTPADGWQNPAFDDSAWRIGKAAWGSDDYRHIGTPWREEHSDLYVRREINLSAADLAKDLYLVYSHDDNMQIFFNGKQVVETPATWLEGLKLHLTADLKSSLHEGKNIIAVHCRNNVGGAYTDFGIYENTYRPMGKVEQAQQTAVDVLATNTYYTFKCGPVYLDLVFTAPMLMDDLDLTSTPINFISYQVRSADGKPHDVKLMLTASPLIASNDAVQPMESKAMTVDGVKYVRTGTIDQPILDKKGDNISIDWGYLYIPGINGSVSLGDEGDIRSKFISSGTLSKGVDSLRSYGNAQDAVLAYYHDFGNVTEGRSFALIGYDEVYDIQYMYKRYKALWAHNGKVTIFDAFNKLRDNYPAIMDKCRQQDKIIYDDGVKAGNKHYAEILSASYRQVIAAHKIFRDEDGKLLFFSKENNSNGCVNTVDLTYPSAPLFLIYNPELEKGMITSILDYSRSGRWTKPFAAHDIGTYPIADGQVYGGDMPLEESGNILTLCAQIAKEEGNADYVRPYWDILKVWADYLVENGQDPANQLCTDDFAGHWAHNANLSIKAIMGVAAFAELAKLLGEEDTYQKYISKAKEMGAIWEKTDAEGDHYRLAFESPDTWSQKYNLVWDKVWGTNIFPEKVADTEIKYYLKKQNKYGLPLDSRKDYTKSDWIMWTAGMAKDKKTFLKFMEPIYNYINETESRVPISDWHDTKTGRWVSFRARSVIGGYWMRVLVDKMAQKEK